MSFSARWKRISLTQKRQERTDKDGRPKLNCVIKDDVIHPGVSIHLITYFRGDLGTRIIQNGGRNEIGMFLQFLLLILYILKLF